MTTYTATPSDIEQHWFIVDAEGMVLGRLATEVARSSAASTSRCSRPHMDTGDNVIVINASKVKVTGRKAEQKQYFHHTGYMGHERFTPFAHDVAKHPERVIEKAVYGMLPKTALGRQVLRRKLRVYADAEHPHAAQQPKSLTFKQEREVSHGRQQTMHTIGRRKEAVCRVYIKPGSGKWDVNGRTLGDYFPRPSLVSAIQQPFTATDTLGRFDVKANVEGGGQTRPGRRAAPRRRPRAREDRRDAPPQAARPRPPHARRARGRAQEAGPSEGSQAVPVLASVKRIAGMRGVATVRVAAANLSRAPSLDRVPARPVDRGDDGRPTTKPTEGRHGRHA